MKLTQCFVLCNALAFGNPFQVDILPNDSFDTLQKKLRKIDLEPILKELYISERGYTTFEDFYQRCSRGVRQTLIDQQRGLYPQIQLEKIGKGGDNCIVSYASYDGLYPDFIEANGVALETVGFNGYYLFSIGAFPGPLKYAGVPYSFKMGMMFEAKKRGFKNVLWIDSAALPLRDPTPLFDWINKTGAFLFEQPVYPTLWRYIFPSTRALLTNLTGTDVLEGNFIWSAIFGLKLNTPEADFFTQEYYQLADLGTPFLSCFPEQFVFSAILGQDRYKIWRIQNPFPTLLNHYQNADIQEIKNAGYYFYMRSH